ncbi:MAG TPA: GNAT family N-acetyltransferase [Ktedonobacterales bacterium]|nr:GNAT family N-acetyltransferase [Ktedonobacterales bacterium]
MIRRPPPTVRELRRADELAIRRILMTSEYIHYRFSPEELPRLLDIYPAVGAFHEAAGPLARLAGGVGEPLDVFLLSNEIAPPVAWIGGFGLTWGEGHRYKEYLDLLLPPLAQALAARGVRSLYYSGGDLDTDWLREPLEARGFHLAALLRSYDKIDFAIPAPGNQTVRVRPYQPGDIPQLIEIDRLCFDDLWRHDGPAFIEIAAAYPYFVVAEDDAGIIGYQFNIVDSGLGYLVRIAVHPRAQGQGVGQRLMAEAIRYFKRHDVSRIILNTEEENTRAHRLYEYFRFFLSSSHGFALGCPIGADGNLG